MSLLRLGMSPDSLEDGQTALCASLAEKRLDLAELLLSHRADPNLLADSQQPLAQAAALGEKAVRLLLSYGADFRQASFQQGRPLLPASFAANAETAKLLAEFPTRYLDAAAEGTLPAVSTAAFDFPDARRELVRLPSGLQWRRQGTRPLQYALLWGRPDVARFLSRTHPLPDAITAILEEEPGRLGQLLRRDIGLASRPDSSGWTLLHYAAAAKQTAAVRLLCHTGSLDLSSPIITPWEIALRQRDYRSLLLLSQLSHPHTTLDLSRIGLDVLPFQIASAFPALQKLDLSDNVLADLPSTLATLPPGLLLTVDRNPELPPAALQNPLEFVRERQTSPPGPWKEVKVQLHSDSGYFCRKRGGRKVLPRVCVTREAQKTFRGCLTYTLN